MTTGGDSKKISKVCPWIWRLTRDFKGFGMWGHDVIIRLCTEGILRAVTHRLRYCNILDFCARKQFPHGARSRVAVILCCPTIRSAIVSRSSPGRAPTHRVHSKNARKESLKHLKARKIRHSYCLFPFWAYSRAQPLPSNVK